MDSFKEIQNLIYEDRLQKLDSFFYCKLKRRINELEIYNAFPFKIKASHIFLSISAGLLFGVFVGRIVQHHIRKDKRVILMENVLNNCYLDEMKYECVDCKEIAEITNSTVSVVESLLFRARLNLKKKIKNRYEN